MKTNRKAILTALVVLAVTLSIISASAFVFNALSVASQNITTSTTSGYHSNWMMGDQWGNMMGRNWGALSSTPTQQVPTATQNLVLPLVGFITLIGAALAGAGGAVYYFTGRARIVLCQPTITNNASPLTDNAGTPYDSISKTLTADERKVMEVLASHNGQYLQKYIRTETGLSRLKVHRIVTRLSERGIVMLEQAGNTNKVYLSSWLNEKTPFSKINSKDEIEHEQRNHGYHMAWR